MRIRGQVVAWIDGAQAPGTNVLVSMGIHLVPDDTGTTVLVNPFTDSATKWMWYTEFNLGYEEMVTDVIDVPGITSFREVVDNKAMRKVAPEQEAQLVVTNTTVATAGAVNVSWSGRFLFGR